MSDDLYNLSWLQAQALLLTGIAVRRIGWDYWIVYDQNLYQINIGKSGTNERVVCDVDFTEVEFKATDYTTAEPSSQDPCIEAIPPMIARGFSFVVEASCQNGLNATVSIDELHAGDSWTVKIYNGEDLLGSTTLTNWKTISPLSLSWPLDPPDDMTANYNLRAIFTNTGAYPDMMKELHTTIHWPLAVFTYSTGTPPASGAGTSYPIVIPYSVARDWYQKRQWALQLDQTQHEESAFPLHSVITPEGDHANGIWLPWAGSCSRANDATLVITRNLFYDASLFPTTSTQTNYLKIDLLSGYRDGDDFYPKIEIHGPDYTSLSASGTGYGTPTASVGGYNIPMVSTWAPGWAGYTGYTNTSTYVFTAK